MTLLEVLVAVSIAGVAFVVLLSGFGINIRSLAVAEDYATAGLLLKELLAEAELKKDIQAGSAAGDFGEQFPGFTWNTETEKDAKLPFYRVNCTVHFTRSGLQREVSGRTILLMKKEGSEAGQR